MLVSSFQQITFTTDSIHRGGKERQLFILTRALLNKGINVNILTSCFSEENYLSEYGLKDDIIKIYSGKTRLDKFRSFKNLVISKKGELLISWDFQSSLFALVLHRKYKFVFINASIQHGIRLFKISHLLRSLICHLSPFVIANSYAGLYANNLKTGKRRFVLYNGIENKFINAITEKDRKEKRNQKIRGYSNRPGDVYITVANLVPYKDYFTVIQALGKLKKHTSFYYFIIGDGPLRNEIVKMINEYDLDDRIFLLGKIENVNDYLFISDIMIHSSRGEGISNAILEGMYAGLPIVATNVGGVPETVFKSSSLLFPYKNVEALYECLTKAWQVFEDFNKESEDYKEHLSKFSVVTMFEKFEEIIEKVRLTSVGNMV